MPRGILHSLEILVAAAAIMVSDLALADDPFAQAEAAYKAGKFGDAAAQYRKVLDGGRFAPEVFFNLGNAEFKQGNLGGAVLNYRKAWMLAPRDPDIRANLNFALGKADASGPDLSLPARALTRLTMGEWAVVAVVSYWLAAGFAIGFIIRRRARGLLRASIALVLIGAAGIAGILQWRALRTQPELVVKARTQALFAPIDNGTPHFALAEGSIVREMEREGDWVRVESGGKSGWIHLNISERVYPWKKN